MGMTFHLCKNLLNVDILCLVCEFNTISSFVQCNISATQIGNFLFL
jgi:hypothetical protein